MEFYVNIFFDFYIFIVLNHDFNIYVELTISQFQTQQLMMSQIRSRIEYLRQTHNILLLILYSKSIFKNSSLANGFNTI